MKFVLVALALFTITANARMFPKGKEPTLKLHALSGTGLTEAQFNQVLDLFEKAMAPLYAAQGKSLHIERLWSNETINSDAQWKGNVCWINAYGGLARAMSMSPTYQALAKAKPVEAARIMMLAYGLVNGHENGHCLGGPPLYPGDTMSDEGQADTYAIDAGRRAGYTDFELTDGGRVLTDVLAVLNGEMKVSWPGPLLPVVTRTNHDHPAAECRYVTMLFRFFQLPRPNCWYAGGAPTGPNGAGAGKKLPTDAPVPTPTPTPVPTPTPTPTPKPVPEPCGCNCCVCHMGK
jgi:hypothetical protein